MENRYDKIEQYAKGQLQGNDLDAFERDMQADKELGSEVDVYSKAAYVFKNIRDFERNDALLKEIDSSLEAEFFFEGLETESRNEIDNSKNESEGRIVGMEQRRSRGRLRVISIAASFLVLIIAGSTVFSNINYSDSRLASSAYQEPIAGTKGIIEDANSVLSLGLEAYNNGNYEEAIQQFSTIGRSSEFYAEAQYNIANAQYKLGVYQSAIAAFETTITSTRDNNLKESAQWYQLLAYLSSGDTGEPFQKLKKSITDDKAHRYNKPAQRLDDSMKSFWRKLVF